MTTDSNDSEERKDLLWQGYHRHHRKAEDEEDRGLSYYVRQVLNVLFLLLAVAGLVLLGVFGTLLVKVALVPVFEMLTSLSKVVINTSES